MSQQGKLDQALVNYLRASDIVINTIPRHRDFTYMKHHHPRWADQFGRLLSVRLYSTPFLSVESAGFRRY